MQLLTVVSVKVVLVTDSVTSLFPEEPRGSSAGTLLLPRKLDIMMRTMIEKELSLNTGFTKMLIEFIFTFCAILDHFGPLKQAQNGSKGQK